MRIGVLQGGPCVVMVPGWTMAIAWSLITSQPVQGLNTILDWKEKAAWRYAREQDTWRHLLGQWALADRIPAAIGKRRLTLERVYSGGQCPLDTYDLIGGIRPVIDALRSTLIVVADDDGIEHVVTQRRGDVPQTVITLEEGGEVP